MIMASVIFTPAISKTMPLSGLLAIANCIMKTRLPSAKERPPGPKPRVKDIVTDMPYVLGVFGAFFVIWGLFFPYFYLQLWVDLHGLSSTLGFYTIAILNAGSVFGRTIPNFVADFVGRLNVLCPIVLVNTGLLFAMFGVTSTAGVIVFSLLYGFFSGAFVSLLPATVALFSRSMEEMGIRMGLAFAVVSFAMLTGTPITGALLTTADNRWSHAIVFSGVTVAVGFALMLGSRHLFALQKNSQHI